MPQLAEECSSDFSKIVVTPLFILSTCPFPSGLCSVLLPIGMKMRLHRDVVLGLAYLYNTTVCVIWNA